MRTANGWCALPCVGAADSLESVCGDEDWKSDGCSERGMAIFKMEDATHAGNHSLQFTSPKCCAQRLVDLLKLIVCMACAN